MAKVKWDMIEPGTPIDVRLNGKVCKVYHFVAYYKGKLILDTLTPVSADDVWVAVLDPVYCDLHY